VENALVGAMPAEHLPRLIEAAAEDARDVIHATDR
jgi:hypothetical protein